MSEIRVDNFKAEDGISAPSFPNGIQVTGVVTATISDGDMATLELVLIACIVSSIKLPAETL